jgi:hypothetical protein
VRLATLEDIFRKRRYATADDVRYTFGDYHNVLHWLTSFLIGNNSASDAYIVDAGGLTESPTPEFHDWLVQWAARATVRNVLQSERKRIAELALEYERTPAVHLDHPPLSVEQFRALISNSEQIRVRLDVLCRFVLIIRGIAKESLDEVAAELGISRVVAEHAYCLAFDTLCSEK